MFFHWVRRWLQPAVLVAVFALAIVSAQAAHDLTASANSRAGTGAAVEMVASVSNTTPASTTPAKATNKFETSDGHCAGVYHGVGLTKNVYEFDCNPGRHWTERFFKDGFQICLRRAHAAFANYCLGLSARGVVLRWHTNKATILESAGVGASDCTVIDFGGNRAKTLTRDGVGHQFLAQRHDGRDDQCFSLPGAVPTGSRAA